MGALDKRIFSGVAIVAALLFVVSAVMLFISDAELTADDNSTALYILTVAGILAIVYSAPTIINGESFVRKISSILVAITGVLFIATAFSGSSAPTVIAAAGIVAGLALVADMLALWVSRIYGAMYVSAILAAVDLVMGVMCLIKGYDGTFVLGLLVAFAAWLAIGTWIALFVKTDSAPKTREVIEAATSSKKEKPQAQNKKATPKAKKVEPKKEETPAEEPKAPVEEPAEAPAEEPKVEEPVVEDVPVATVATPVSVPDEPYESVISEQIQTRDDEKKPAEPEPDWGKVTEDSMASSDPEEGEDDLYTDNSPEARVRRAAWNKNLRCRRGYGPHNIPVAFVKAKVAVYVDEPGADTSVDEELRAEGWEVLRFNAADVTDGKDECEKICAVVKPRTKTTKKKSKK